MIITDINGIQRECIKAYLDKDYPGFIKVEYRNERRHRNYNEWYPIDEFLAKNQNFSGSEEIKPEAPEITGQVSSATNITLTDKTQDWQPNSYAGFPVWIARGKGEGQVRNVLSNTKDTLVIDKAWDIKLNKFSQYVLSRNIHAEMPIMGNVSEEESRHEYELKAKKIERDRKRDRKKIERLIQISEDSN